ncbi:unnamed protein product [Fraxinus pennsylvanica]|uniref:GDSL esterase/lipase n=1 Tax=Fraxinus pennsylvanica TaxID=56036 RepID=A0AAD1Z9V3_9LAMI|nr:unnamed protein product [Fraxinus pennsylvanica]
MIDPFPDLVLPSLPIDQAISMDWYKDVYASAPLSTNSNQADTLPSGIQMVELRKPSPMVNSHPNIMDSDDTLRRCSAQPNEAFKAKVDEYRGQDSFPSSDIFGNELYTINIGQNDITGYLGSTGPDKVKQNAPQVISQITSTIKKLYWLGERIFLVINLALVGCYSRFLDEQSNSLDLDESGGKISYKNANPKSHGMQHGITARCGQGGGAYNFNPQVFCSSSKEINGKTVTATAYSDPQPIG